MRYNIIKEKMRSEIMRENLVGMKIKVNYVEKGGEYKDIIGRVGIIEKNNNTYGVRVFGIENSASEYGYFWLSRSEFDIVDDSYVYEEPEKCEMIDGYYIVEVKGSHSKRYSYKCRFDVNVGDKLVCEDEDYIQTVVGIYNLENARMKNPTKEVVCVIDYSEINAKKERAKEMLRIKTELDKKVREIQTKIDYDFYASKDDSIAKLLKQLNELKGGN